MPARRRTRVLPRQRAAEGAFKKTKKTSSVSEEKLELLQDKRALAPGRLPHTSSRPGAVFALGLVGFQAGSS